MRVIVPTLITAISSSNLPEPGAGEAVYSAGTEYIVGDEVISTTTHLTYTSLQGRKKSGVTITIASPGVVTWPEHNLVSGDPVKFTTTGALPTGLVADTTYYAKVLDDDTFELATTSGGTSINTSGSQSGTHTGKSRINFAKPLPVAPATETDWWIVSGVPNKWKPFDLDRSSQATYATSMTFTFAPGERVGAIALLGLDAEQLEISCTSPSYVGVVYSKSEDLRRRRVYDGYDYCFAEFYNAASYVAFDVPPITDMIFTVTLSKASGTVLCGSIVVGQTVYLGATQYDAESDALNFSEIGRDDFGEATLTRRRSIPKTTQTMELSKARVSSAYKLRQDLNAVPAVWAALDDGADDYFEALLILGVYKRFTINVAHPQQALITVEVEEI